MDAGLNWQRVAMFLHRPPAEFVWSVLDGHGIPARVRGDDADGTAGLALGGVFVEVPTDRARKACTLLASVEDDWDDQASPARTSEHIAAKSRRYAR